MIAILEMCHHTVKKSPWRSHPNHEIVQMEMCELRNEGRACMLNTSISPSIHLLNKNTFK